MQVNHFSPFFSAQLYLPHPTWNIAQSCLVSSDPAPSAIEDRRSSLGTRVPNHRIEHHYSFNMCIYILK